MTLNKAKDFLVTNGATLYYEKCGTGPAVLFIAGSPGDAGNFTRAADVLSDEFTVVTYDGRGNSRSPRPTGWKTTSVVEQADDAAGLIQALGLAPAMVFGASAGALIALDVMIKYPRLFRAGILQEPSILFRAAGPERGPCAPARADRGSNANERSPRCRRGAPPLSER